MVYKFPILLLLAYALAFASGCKDIVVKVGKKDRSAPVGQNAGANAEVSSLSISDSEFYLTNLDNLQSTSGDKLINRLEQNWRLQFRKQFRTLRNAIQATAEKQHSYQDGIYFNVKADDCSALERNDLGVWSGLENLPNLVEGSLLAYISSDDAKLINPDLVGVLDVSTQLILFELGMRANGSSLVEVDGDVTYNKSKVLWKVDPEIQDSKEDQAGDLTSMSIEFTRGLKLGRPYLFEMELVIGEGIYEGKPKGVQYRVNIKSDWDYPSLQGVQLINSIKIFKDDQLSYSRRFELEQSTQTSSNYRVTDVIRAGLKNESSRQAIIDFYKMEKCAAEHSRILVPGVIGMGQSTAEKLLTDLGFQAIIVEDLSKGDPNAQVRAQKPEAGAHSPYGATVHLILDKAQENPFDDLVNGEMPEEESEDLESESPSD